MRQAAGLREIANHQVLVPILDNVGYRNPFVVEGVPL